MKKSLIIISALAFAGLFASCQKENVAAPEQTSEQKVITINPNGFKGDADIEPLIALGQALNESADKEDKKEENLVKDILRDIFRSIADLIGSSETAYPSHSTRYLGNWKTFGAAIAEIRDLSYDARVPSIEFELGNAPDLKIGRVEVMPYSDFYFKYEGNFDWDKNTRKRAVGLSSPINDTLARLSGLHLPDSIALLGGLYLPANDSLSGRILRREPPVHGGPVLDAGVWSGLIVKFTYKHGIYAFAIGMEAEAGRNMGYPDYSDFDILYGYFDTDYDNLAEWYHWYMSNEEAVLPIIPSTEFFFYSEPGYKYSWLYHNGLGLYAETSDDGLGTGAYLALGYDDYYYQLYAQAEDAAAAGDFYRDFLWAEAFGCNESEGKALIDEYHNTFTDELYLFGWYYTDDWYSATFTTNLAISLEAKGLRWKPVLGFTYKDETEDVFVPFKTYTENDCESTEFKVAFDDMLSADDGETLEYYTSGWSVE